MSLEKPSFSLLTNGEESIFLAWSYVLNATEYEIEVKENCTGEKRTYSTTSKAILIKNLENDQFYEVRVTALHENKRSEPSIGYVVRPKLRQSLAVVKVTQGETPGSVHLQWTATPTDQGFLVDRCDIGQTKGYKRIAWVPYSIVTRHEDETNCRSLKKSCSGHYYTVRYVDRAWEGGAGVLSKKVFCMSEEPTIISSMSVLLSSLMLTSV